MSALGAISAAFLVIVPLAVTPDLIDRYRTVKESLSRTEGIVGGFLLIVALSFAGTARFREMLRERAVLAWTSASAVWAIATTLWSTHRAHSIDSLVTFLTCLLVFFVTWYGAPRMSLAVLDWLVPVVLINVALVTLQEYGVYQPFRSDPGVRQHLRATGLIGNPNIVGTYMALMAVMFSAGVARSSGTRRWWQLLGATAAGAGVLVSQTRTAVIGLAAGLVLLAIGRSMRRAVIAFAAVAVLLAAGTALRMPAVTRLMRLPDLIARRGVAVALSGRVLPVLTALDMARERPFTGMGPGTFKYHYMPFATNVLARTGPLPRGLPSVNFGEVHNDHVQLIAETGVPGYLLFLGAMVTLVRAVRRTDAGTARAAIAREMALPLAGTLLVLCLAQFPLHVPITRHLLVTVAGLLLGWSRSP